MKTFLLLLMILSLDLYAVSGGGGNGGDVFYCEKDTSLNDFQGDYTLDYLMTEMENSSPKVIKYSRLEDYINYLSALMKSRFTDLAIDFTNFSKSIPVQGYDLYSSQYNWQNGSGELFDIKDENLERIIPGNCHFKSQAVIKKKNIYFYDGNIFESLPVSKPLQMSYLIVHEWLRNYIVDAQHIRLVNSFLHQKSTAKLSDKEFKRKFSALSGIPDSIINYASRAYSFLAIKESLKSRNFDLVTDYSLVDNSLLIEENYFILRTLAKEKNWQNFNKLTDTLSKKDLNSLFVYFIENNYFYALDKIQTKIELSAEDIQKVSHQCIVKNSLECLKILSKHNIELANVEITFAPSYRDGHRHIDYPESRGLRIDTNAMGMFKTSNTKHINVGKIGLLTFAALEGRVAIVKYLLSLATDHKDTAQVRTIKSHFQFLTKCLNCNLTSKTKTLSLEELLNLRVNSLKYNLKRSKDKSIEIKKWIEDIKEIKGII